MGERYERNMRSIALVALFLVVVNVATGYINFMNGYHSAVVTSVIFILSGLAILYFTLLRRNRPAAVATGLAAFIVVFTYSAFSVAHGFPIFWTLLLPLGFCYLVDVRAGICLSLYFLALYCILFYTPLRYVATAQYTDVIAQRFPILYLANVVLTTFIMVQYHLATLHQMDYAQQLLEAKQAADQANAAKSEFLASMSHEIRTPIHAILGMNEMVLRESSHARRLDDADAHGVQEALDNIHFYARDVRDASNDLLSIVNTILDFSKREEGSVSSDPAGNLSLLSGQGAAEAGEYNVQLKAPDARVLAVDDTDMNLNVVKALLKATEVQVDTATSGAQAIELARENNYDLILMDQRMPEMSGTEAMQHIRSQEGGRNRSTPIVCLTADAVRGARERYLAEGFTDFVTKPIDGNQLERVLVLYLPDEKVAYVPKQDDHGGADKGEVPVHTGTNFVPLAAVGIDPAVGLSFCQDDENLYLSLLEDYARGAQERLSELGRYWQAGDWKNLAIVAHAIKSTSQMIGATTLSELSVQVERAADEGRAQEVAGDFERMRELYEKTAAAIRQVVPSSVEPTPEDEEILEFFPDQYTSRQLPNDLTDARDKRGQPLSVP